MKSPAARMSHLSMHFFAALKARLATMQAEGRDVIRLDEGAPDMPPAKHIVETLAQSASKPDRHSYQPHHGSTALRYAWTELYQREHQVKLDAETEVLPLLGSKEGIFHLAQALIDPGDIVIVPDPGYITYTRGTLMAGGQTFYVPLLAQSDYLPDLETIPEEIACRAKILWLNYPNNPTAAVASVEFFTQVMDYARRHNLLVCHDAAYTQVTFNGQPAPSILQIPGAKEVAVEFNTLSKSYNMAGWRVAALVGNADVVQTMHTLKTNVDSSYFLPIMEASIAAMCGDQTWTQKRNEIYRQRRDALVQGLHDLGLMALLPQASLYVWSPIPPGWDSVGFANAVLEGAGVSLTPGTVFGRNGEGYVRFSITVPLEQVEEAVQRLKKWMGQ